MLQRIDLCDTISLEPGDALAVEGFAEDTIVTRALESLAAAAGVEPRWRARIEKRIPVAAGLGGGSSDAATALRLANDDARTSRSRPSGSTRSRAPSAPTSRSSSRRGPKLGTGDGSTLEPLALPQDYAVLLLLPDGAVKESTAAVYGRFDGAARLRRAARAHARDRRDAHDRRATSPSCRRTTSPPRRSPPSSSPRAPSAPTSAAPARRSTASSPTAPRPSAPRPRSARSAASGSPILPGSLFSMENPAVTSPGPGSFLAERRIRIALGIAVVEGLLVVVNVIPEWAVFVVAVAARRLLVDVGPPRELADGAPGQLDPRRLADLPHARAAVLHLLQDGRVRRARDPRDRRAGVPLHRARALDVALARGGALLAAGVEKTRRQSSWVWSSIDSRHS